MKTEFKQIKSIVKNDENAALQKAMKSLGVAAEMLETAHTEKTFVFKLKETPTELAEVAEVKPKLGDLFPVEKTETTTLQTARQLAMNHFKTFEGNIKIVDQDETHFVFAKVRQ